jgi:CheY-like chemotaxis protein
MSHAPVRQSHHILIIDDSARLRYALADLIVAACLASGRAYRVLHGDKDGRYTQSNESLNPGLLAAPPTSQASDSSKLEEFAIYTAPSPKQALFIINSPLFTRLTIISDVMMPSDTEVGIVGMVEALARRQLPVNLVFASSDAQNRYLIARLVESGKAYFVVKAEGVWQELSQALVNRTNSFQYKVITPSDYAGMQGGPVAARPQGVAHFGDEVSTNRPAQAVAANSRPAQAVAPAYQRSQTATSQPVAQPAAPAQASSPKPKAKTGLNPFAALLRVIRGR